MSQTTIVVLVLVGLIIIIALIAWGIYKAGFRATKVTVKTGVLEAEMERPPSQPEGVGLQAEPGPPTGPKIHQRASDGGAITQSGITAPANAAAEIDQQAKGPESKIDDSPIKLT